MSPIREYIYIGAIAVLLIGAATIGIYVHRCHVAHEQLASIHAQSVKDLREAKNKILADAADHAAAIKSQKEVSDANLKAAADQHTADLNRLRQLDADRAKRADLARAPAGPGTSATCGTGESEAELRLRSLEQVAAGLEDANRAAGIAIDALTVERDSLNGKP